MRLRSCIALLLLLFGLACAGAAGAAATVRVVETWPAGDPVTLPRGRDFFLRIAYSSDEPVRIWATPYFRGKPANAGHSPSPRYVGQGEMLGWFFLMQPGAEVDEIRITAGDGGTRSTPVVAVHRVRVVGGGEPSAGDTPPAWVAELGERARLAQRQQAESAQRDAPAGAGDAALFAGFAVAVVVLGLLGIVAPLWALRRWEGGWRIAAAIPAIMLGFVVLRIVVGVMLDPRSHNLWPFELLFAGATSAGAVGLLRILRALSGAGRAA